MQQDKIRISNAEAAKTLRDSPILHCFLEPTNPSEVAKKVGMPANLVHHHVKRAVELGLLFQRARDGRKIFYQLTAKTFTHKRGLLSLEQKVGADLTQISSAFLESYLHSESLTSSADDSDYDVYGFADHITPPPTQPEPRELMQHHPAHFQALTIYLGVAQYQKLIQTLAKLLEETKPDNTAKACTIALLGFAGEWRKGHEMSMLVSSFALEGRKD